MIRPAVPYKVLALVLAGLAAVLCTLNEVSAQEPDHSQPTPEQGEARALAEMRAAEQDARASSQRYLELQERLKALLKEHKVLAGQIEQESRRLREARRRRDQAVLRAVQHRDDAARRANEARTGAASAPADEARRIKRIQGQARAHLRGKDLGSDPRLIELEKDLDKILRRTATDGEAIEALRAAGQSGNKDFLDKLISIVYNFPDDAKRHHSVVFEALDAAAMLGNITERLRSDARDHKDNMWLARSCILLLARDPDEKTMKVLRSIREENPHNCIQSAISKAEYVYSIKRKYGGLEKPPEKIALVLKYFGGYWNVLEREVYESTEAKMTPSREWARQELQDLSEQYPSLVARSVLRIDTLKYISEDHNREYRQHVAERFLSQKAQEEFRKLVAEGPRQFSDEKPD